MNIKLITTIAIFALTALASPSYAAQKKKTSEKKPAEPAKAADPAKSDESQKPVASKPIPYQGNVGSVDATAKTFTLKNKDGKEHVYTVTEKTQITSNEAPATFDDIKVGEIVRGTRLKLGDAKWEAVKVMIGAKETPAKGKKETAKPAVAKPDAAPEEKKPN
jgi:hypothetical protein